MIRSTRKLAELDEWYARTRISSMSYEEALAVFTALWQHARQLNPEFPGPWEEDIAPDLELARVLNGLPPRS